MVRLVSSPDWEPRIARRSVLEPNTESIYLPASTAPQSPCLRPHRRVLVYQSSTRNSQAEGTE
jgi:hypothetical protein